MLQCTFRFILSVSILAVAACAALPTHKDDLGKKNEDFIQRVRWLDFAGASLHFTMDHRDDFIERFGEDGDLKITDLSVARIEIDVPGERVVVHYRLDYYRLPSVTLETVRFSLTWEQKAFGADEAAYWRITEPFPDLP